MNSASKSRKKKGDLKGARRDHVRGLVLADLIEQVVRVALVPMEQALVEAVPTVNAVPAHRHVAAMVHRAAMVHAKADRPEARKAAAVIARATRRRCKPGWSAFNKSCAASPSKLSGWNKSSLAAWAPPRVFPARFCVSALK